MQSANRVSLVRQAFEERGIPVAEWARQHGFKVALVYSVLAGRTRGLRGEAHQIALQLGLKPQRTRGVEWLDRVFAPEIDG